MKTEWRNGEIINQLTGISGVGWAIKGANFISVPMNQTKSEAFAAMAKNCEITLPPPQQVERGAVYTLPHAQALQLLQQHSIERNR